MSVIFLYKSNIITLASCVFGTIFISVFLVYTLIWIIFFLYKLIELLSCQNVFMHFTITGFYYLNDENTKFDIFKVSFFPVPVPVPSPSTPNPYPRLLPGNTVISPCIRP